MTAAERLESLLAAAGQPPLSAKQLNQFERYLALLVRWNQRVNLTAVRDEESILRRHFVESISCARLLPAGVGSLLDFGSGGGFPGLPCAICLPAVNVVLAESQGKKAAFLQEAVRTLELNVRVHAGRAESLTPELLFDVATLRAVDKMKAACGEALTRVKVGGWLAVMATRSTVGPLVEDLQGLAWCAPSALPNSEQEILLLGRKLRG